MLSTKELNTCIELLADINRMSNDNSIKMKTLDIGYILKQELDNVSLIESMSDDIRNRQNGMGSMDVKRLLEDNIQLYNEKEKLVKQNKKLRELLDSKLKVFEEKTTILTEKIKKFTATQLGLV